MTEEEEGVGESRVEYSFNVDLGDVEVLCIRDIAIEVIGEEVSSELCCG